MQVEVCGCWVLYVADEAGAGPQASTPGRGELDLWCLRGLSFGTAFGLVRHSEPIMIELGVQLLLARICMLYHDQQYFDRTASKAVCAIYPLSHLLGITSSVRVHQEGHL